MYLGHENVLNSIRSLLKGRGMTVIMCWSQERSPAASTCCKPRNTNKLLQAWCDQSRAQGGWTVIQRRQDGSVNFFRTWEQYKVHKTKHYLCGKVDIVGL